MGKNLLLSLYCFLCSVVHDLHLPKYHAGMRLQLSADDGRCCRASCKTCRFHRRHEAFKLSNGLRCRSCCMGCCGGIYRHLVSICDKEDRTGGGSTHFHAQPHGMTQNILSAPAKAHQSEKRNRFLDSFFHPFLTTLNASSEADCKCPLYSRFYDILRGFLCKRQMSSIPYKSSIPATFQSLLLINHLEDEKFQVIGLICGPQNRMIR